MVNRSSILLAAAVFGGGIQLSACTPTLVDERAIVSDTRVLAVRVTPAEARPGDAITVDALVAGPSGTESPSIFWAFCHARKPLAELGPVNRACLDPSSASVVALGSSASVASQVPNDACQYFGPEVPAPKPGEPLGRPADPDGTGGYYQPILAALQTATSVDRTLGSARLQCGLAGASPDDLVAYNQRYRANVHPAVQSLVVDGRAFDASKPVVVRAARGATVTVSATWPSCGSASNASDPGCAGAEPYVAFDAEARTVVDRREGIHVSWASTSGAFANAATGRAGSELETSSDNTFTVPDVAGTSHAWVVLRDDRGGVGWLAFDVVAE